MKRLWIMFALIMLFAIGPPAIAATTKAVNTQKNQAEQISVVTTTPVALGGATSFADSEIALQTMKRFSSETAQNVTASGATYNTFPVLVSTTSTDDQGAANQKAFPATNKKRGVRARYMQERRRNGHQEGHHRLTAARINAQQINDDGRHNTNRQQLIS